MRRHGRRPSLHSDGRFYHRWRPLQPSSDAGCAASSAMDGRGTGIRDGGQIADHRARQAPDACRRLSTTRTSETCARRTPWGPGLMALHVLQFQQERSVTPMARAAPASSTPLHEQDWCVLRSLQSPRRYGPWKEQKHLAKPITPPYHRRIRICRALIVFSLVNGVNDE